MRTKDCLIILAKNPVPGFVKTRLLPHLTSSEAATLYEAFIEDVFDIGLRMPKVQKVIAYSGDGQRLKDLIRKPCHWIYQGPGDLGVRITRAFQWSHDQGFHRTLLIGSDSPNIPVTAIQNAFKQLRNCDVVLGPAWDGGFYIIGMKRPLVKEVLEGIEWSKSWTLMRTLQKMKCFGKKTEILPAWYDVDVIQDLNFLCLDLWCNRSKNGVCAKTVKALNNLGMMNQ